MLLASHRIEFPDPAAGISLAWSPDDVRLAFGTGWSHIGVTGPVRFPAVGLTSPAAPRIMRDDSALLLVDTTEMGSSVALEVLDADL